MAVGPGQPGLDRGLSKMRLALAVLFHASVYVLAVDVPPAPVASSRQVEQQCSWTHADWSSGLRNTDQQHAGQVCTAAICSSQPSCNITTPIQRNCTSHSSTAGSQLEGAHLPPPPAPTAQEEQQVWIVRFDQYSPASEHHATLSASVAGEGQLWRWIIRHNAAAAHPTDFGLVSVQTSAQDVQQQLKKVQGVRDIHLDRQFHGKLHWKPEGVLKDLVVDASNQFHDTEQEQGKDVSRDDHDDHDDSEIEDVDSVFSVSKRPGRLSTSFMMPASNEAEEDTENRASTQHIKPSRGPSPAGHDRQLLYREQALDVQHHHRVAGMAADALRAGDKHSSAGTSPTTAHPRHDGHGSSQQENARQRRQQRRLRSSRMTLTAQLGAERIYRQGFSGQGVKVGVFDTGIQPGHPHIRNLKERTNWTHQDSLSDGLGHGSFVAGVIGSQDKECPGLAPDVELYTFKVFTDDQVSFTSWFLDAFNYAMLSGMHIINLSIGGPDFLDLPFVEKVLEVTSSGMLMVSAIGNDGPLYGTLNNPADQNDVIGVGGIDDFNAISSFSSRGMTTWELKLGSGRVKPDVMAYSRDVHGSKIQAGCRTLSGTSVASPVVAGAVCLLASTVPEPQRWSVLNPASMKQALVEGADRLPQLNIYEQGSGKLNLHRSMAVLKDYQPRASVIPAQLDLTDHPYMWPYSRQPLYAGALPVVFNATVLNALGVTGTFSEPPQFYASDEGGALLHVSFEYSQVLWPWSGYLALYIRVRQAGRSYDGLANGMVVFTITSPPGDGEEEPRRSTVVVPLKARIIPPPARARRVIWDQFHSIKYPPGYIPRDNLDIKHDILDWHGDHLFTNYQGLYNALRDNGYYVEILSTPATCFNASEYGTLLIVDPEEEYYAQEVRKLAEDVGERGLNLVVFADWYHVDSMLQMKFYDDNTRSWWTPVTGGANVPALNDLLAPYSIELGDAIVHGMVNVAGHRIQISHGADIAVAPVGSCVYTGTLSSMSDKSSDGGYAYMTVTPVGNAKGHVAVFSDSNCLDSSHQVTPCYELLMQLIRRVTEDAKNVLCTDAERRGAEWRKASHKLPMRRADINFTDFSFVLQHPQLMCYPASHCEAIGSGSCTDYLNTESRTSTMKKALLSSTNVAIKYPSTSSGSGDSNQGSGKGGGAPAESVGTGAGTGSSSGTAGSPGAVEPDISAPKGAAGVTGMQPSPGVSGSLLTVVNPSRFGVSTATLQLVSFICVIGLMAVLVVWQCAGRSKAGRDSRYSRRASSFQQVP